MDLLEEFFFEFLIPLVGCLFGLSVLALGIRSVDHHLDVSKCHTFSDVSGYQTKFVDYNFFSYGCLGKTSDNRWIPTERLHDVNVEGR